MSCELRAHGLIIPWMQEVWRAGAMGNGVHVFGDKLSEER